MVGLEGLTPYLSTISINDASSGDATLDTSLVIPRGHWFRTRHAF